jgi:branched-chain amino acid transport system permease protein
VTPFIIAGLVTGCIYAISALGLVLTYTSSRVFNFAHGVIAWTIAVFYYWLHEYEDGPQWSIPVAAPVAILVVAPLLGLALYGLLFKRLTNVSPTVRLVSTVGLWVALPAVVKIVFTFVNEGEIFQPDGLVTNPSDPEFIKVFGTFVNTTQFVVIVSAVVIAVAATLFLRLTPLGLATRAAVDHPRNAAIHGINTERVTAVSWMIGIGLAGLAGVLFAPVVSLAEFQYTLLLVGSFVAVVIGRMTSLPLAFLGAIGVGVLQQVWVKYQPETGFFSLGVTASIPFIVMLLFLVGYSFTSTGMRREAFALDARAMGGAHGDAPPLPPSHGWRRVAGPLVLVAALAIVPVVFDSYWLGIFTIGVALSIIFLSTTLVTGEGGIISLAQITFAGIGAFAAARLADSADVWNVGLPVWLAIIIGGLVAVPFGLLLALPSLRLGDLYLALLTVGFALLVQEFVWRRPEFENFGAGRLLARPFGLTLDDRVSMYFVVVAVFLVCALLIVNLKRATAGIVYASIRSSEPAAVTTGISVVRAKLLLFAVSAFVAGLGGAMWGSTVGTVTPRSFDVLVGVVWLAIIVTWGVRSVPGALLAGLLFAIAPFKLAAILILPVIFLTGGFFTRLLLSKAYRKPVGALLMALFLVVGALASYRMWTKMSDDTAVHIVLAILALVVGLLVGLRLRRIPSLGANLRTAILVIAIAAGVGGAYYTTTLDLSLETVKEVPTMLFGLGAIFLAREPRGVLYDMVNRQRLRQLEDTERREEEAAMAAERVGAAS